LVSPEEWDGFQACLGPSLLCVSSKLSLTYTFS
jgi:hypothetical protein